METDRSEDFCCLLDSGNLIPIPLLEQVHAGRVMQSRGGMCAEKCRETLPVGQRWGAGAIGELYNHKKIHWLEHCTGLHSYSHFPLQYPGLGHSESEAYPENIGHKAGNFLL